jgi:hypothetical protein
MELLDLEQDMVNSGVDMFLSPVVLNRTGATAFNPLYLDMTASCCIIFDKNDFLKRVLQNTRENAAMEKSKTFYRQSLVLGHQAWHGLGRCN